MTIDFSQSGKMIVNLSVEGTNIKQNKMDATADPGVGDDSDDGYAVGSRWLNVTTQHEFICLDATLGAAVWNKSVTDKDFTAASGFMRKTGAGAYEAIKANMSASVAPGVGDDSDDGYAVGSKWYDTTADKAYECLDSTVGAAVWKEITGGGTGSSPGKLKRVDTGAWEVARRSNGVITAIADAGGGKCLVTSAGHQQIDGTSLTIAGTTDYNATYTISDVTTDNFQITATYTSSQTGTFWVAANVYYSPDQQGGAFGTIKRRRFCWRYWRGDCHFRGVIPYNKAHGGSGRARD